MIMIQQEQLDRKKHPDKIKTKNNPLGGFNKKGEDFHSMQYKSLRKLTSKQVV